jgi:F5/8 type C domain-containing protein/cellulase (glycosyl hydrolase family 5)
MVRGRILSLSLSLSAVALATPLAIARSDCRDPVAHRIGVRQLAGRGEFYDTVTGAPFVPRGVNYVRLGWQTDAWPPYGALFYHNVFRLGQYNPSRVAAALSYMKADGYNTVRVFLEPLCSDGCIGNPAGGLRTAYLENVRDFLREAQAHDMHVILTEDFSPRVEPYSSLSTAQCCAQFEQWNLQYLTPGGLEANRRFWRDFITGMQALGAPLDVVLAFELRNELFFDSDRRPLSLSSGLVTTANGQTYDMSSSAQKQLMMDQNLVYWINELRTVIRTYDPQALVTIGFFQPQAPHPARPGDLRVIRTGPAIASSSADFIDLHAYPGIDLTLSQFVDNFEMAGHPERPILMGEFGAAKAAYATATDAALALGDWMAQSCAHGFDGWLAWTWDTAEQPELWNALEINQVIHRVLAPGARPDPCAPMPVANLALGRPTSASGWLGGNEPDKAVDGADGTVWNSGGFAPQWIEVDLGAPHDLGRVRLSVAQYPAGNTVHRVYVRGPGAGDAWTLLVEFNGFTSDPQVLEYTAGSPVPGVRGIRVETLSSPSWVAWREIQVIPAELIGPPPGQATQLSPASGSTLATRSPTITWNPAPDASTYHLQVARDAGFTQIAFESAAITGSSIEVPDLGTNAQHYWRVRAGNLKGVSSWPPGWTFTTQLAPPTVALVEPPSGAVVDAAAVVLRWQVGGQEVECYQAQLAPDTTFATVLVDSTVADTMLALAPLAEGAYAWRVRGRNDAGSGAYGGPNTFVTAGAVSVAPRARPTLELGLAGRNPFWDSTRLRFALPAAGPVAMTLVDVAGRRVRTLIDGRMEAGAHEALLDGRRLPAGLYVCRLATATGTRTIRVIRLSGSR